MTSIIPGVFRVPLQKRPPLKSGADLLPDHWRYPLNVRMKQLRKPWYQALAIQLREHYKYYQQPASHVERKTVDSQKESELSYWKHTIR